MIFKRSLLSCGVSVSVMLASAPLWVQAQSQPTLEEVVVTGIRASLNQAADIKRESYSIVDSVVAEDIGKLPDNNVVESLQRVSGIQVTDRGQGETSTVLIRGLSDVSTTVNGRTIYGTVDRAIELADIPSTLVSRIDVSKSRSADQYENGIAGTIDVRTFRPSILTEPVFQLPAA
ncbi:TonB-dependent receptor plug domain-containing protein [Marinimicrobium sp. ARAG 43.8]|uniref:TonB-dependent receptor plug domain-containing protein n=1 Tax=Marinimicrobium sp. ARAG 43.8 TaxID=3418719 RepID=UPI003CE896FE